MFFAQVRSMLASAFRVLSYGPWADAQKTDGREVSKVKGEGDRAVSIALGSLFCEAGDPIFLPFFHDPGKFLSMNSLQFSGVAGN